MRYLVTSLDTHYQGTATGLFISFHHLEQELEQLPGVAGFVPAGYLGFGPLTEADSGYGLAGKSGGFPPVAPAADALSPVGPRLEMQRLQLMLTQDLNILLDLAADWAVKLNMEVSRGNLFSGGEAADDESSAAGYSVDLPFGSSPDPPLPGRRQSSAPTRIGGACAERGR